MNIPITDHALYDLICKVKQSTPNFKEEIEDKLEQFANIPPQSSHRQYGTSILGIFKANRCRLNATSPCHFSAKTEKISEGILRTIFNELDEEKQLMIELQA
ncbi:MAG TPA: hypothetical protein VNE86_03815, partial [Nitrososphaerales archaeon]|nr:hypothetical protein [Nitrososphaerales archaeon]